ncbi:branched-chain amino acid aminotransferase [Tenacibaculum holothuriorum]|uniref:Branched-chain amino acid aminotransferase n=1 Tax=Tenacibaculum holothuriorum TaxID=1635173 RepID=A0A1Y2PCB8_9FLAO|nr:DUF4920 domain-containing protein [Tenacibaculum holothuriorum]OSY87318.1 branched-chain amino acid aminotransferase [Tenacibaculum holothuriorum]
MKRILCLGLLLSVLLTACKVGKKEENKKQEEVKVEYVSFGEKISNDNAIDKEAMTKKFEEMNVGDTIDVKFVSTIDAVCQKKGCWIKVPLNKDKKSFVKFKDYAFFLPMNSAGSKVVLNGKAFKNEVSVEELQHYAKDAGKSEEEIAKITKPKTTYSFLADGVLLESSVNEK